MTYLKLSTQNKKWTISSLQKETHKDDLTQDEAKQYIASLLEEHPNLLGGIMVTDALQDDDTQQFLKELTEDFNTPFFISKENGEPTRKTFEQAQDSLAWNITYFGYPKGKKEYSLESLLTIGNGYVGLRGATPEMAISDNQYPATYLSGLYNSAESIVDGHTVINEDFVNVPNFQKIYLIVNGITIDMEHNDLTSLTRNINLKTGEYTSLAKVTIKDQGLLTIKTTKIVNMKSRHFYGISYEFSTDFDANIILCSKSDGRVYNYNVERYRKLEQHHLDIIDTKAEKTYASMMAKTTQSNLYIYQQSKLSSDSLDLDRLVNSVSHDFINQTLAIQAKENHTYAVDKIVHIEKSATKSDDKPVDFPTFNELKEESFKEWDRLWELAQIKVEGDLMSQKLLNINTFHMLVSASPEGNLDIDASITARGLHGEAYRGHIFWDELFILPFYMLHFPDTAKQLLLYRFNRLNMAKKLAKESGHKGAMFPWQSGLDGSEQSQKVHLNPLSGEWKEDNSHRQRHVSLAVAYNIWLYTHITHDQSFMTEYGKSMLEEITKFWTDLATFDSKTNKYHISGVMGPDEFHEAYPNAKENGLTDNAYTNVMFLWLIKTINQLEENNYIQFDFSIDERQKMQKISRQLNLDINDDDIIAQYQGYLDLKEIDWDHYKSNYQNIYRMDRILNAEGLSADDYQVAKQADSLMLFYNLPANEVTDLLTQLNYNMSPDYIEKNLNYYLARTSHGSTLSRIVHSQLATIISNDELAWELYQEALHSDYHDIQGGTTAEGIHTGVMASSLYLSMTAFTGMDVRGELLSFKPNLPKQWQSLSFNIFYQGKQLFITLTEKDFGITSSDNLTIVFNDTLIHLAKHTKKILPTEAN